MGVRTDLWTPNVFSTRRLADELMVIDILFKADNVRGFSLTISPLSGTISLVVIGGQRVQRSATDAQAL
jgi:hypothetical protein